MSDEINRPLIVFGVDVSHSRLVDLAKLADQAQPFYLWVEGQFQNALNRHSTLDMLLQESSEEDMRQAIRVCYEARGQSNLPLLFDGIGRSYQHGKACYYFFSWLIRDAPQQRLGPLIQRMPRTTEQRRTFVEAHVLAALICKYRENVKNFSWLALREIIIDRLEGSRRSIRGREKEAVVRTALIAAIQNYYSEHGGYGIYAGVEIPEGQVFVGNETFDVSANLLNEQNKRVARILVPIKTRETEGGGHAHLFTRDITSAINAARFDNQEDFVISVIVARNWSEREAEAIRMLVDYAAIFDLSPNQFVGLSAEQQNGLNSFIATVLSGAVKTKTVGFG